MQCQYEGLCLLCDPGIVQRNANPSERLAAFGRIARRVGEQPDLPSLSRFVYGELSELLAVDSFFVARSAVRNDAVQGVLIVDGGVEYPLTGQPTGHEARSSITCPIRVNGTVAGQLGVMSNRDDAYGSDDEPFVQVVADQLGVALTREGERDELRAAQQAAADKVAKLDEMRHEFVATVSHELRTPLTGILGYLELMLSRWGSLDDTRRRDMLQRTQSAATRLEHLVTDLLLFSNVEHQALRLQISSFPIELLIDQACDMMRTKYRGQHLDVAQCPDTARVLADSQRAIQVIANLLDNAIKYSPVGSTVHLRWVARRQHVEVVVEDHGPGIKAEDMDRLFKRFSTLGHQPRPGQVGSGIGLYVCQRLVEAMNGKIWAVSRPGRGSVFHFTLPRALEPTTAREMARPTRRLAS